MAEIEDIHLPSMTAADLIAHLDASIPHLCIAANQTEIEAHRYAGARDMVDQLKSILDEQTDPEEE